jgi:hypothetical protein
MEDLIVNNKNIYDEFTNLIFNSDESEKSIFINNTQKNIKAYRFNYFFGLLNVLENTYTATKLFLEEDNFKFFCKGFIEEVPSLSSNVDDYGKGFSDYLASRKELSDVGFIKHLAALDWFWFYNGAIGESIELPKGVLDFWGKITNGEELVDIEIDEEVNECIEVFMDEENNYYMKAIIK